MPRPWILLVLAVAACPQASPVDPAAGKVAAPPVIDGRVVADGGDLYPAKRAPAPPPTPPSPGTGLSDESNGKCRLFAPEMPEPTCCERQLGLDVPTIQAACGLAVYLGESFYNTCGYYFLPATPTTGTPARWFRLSTLADKTPRAAAEAHDRHTRRIPGFEPATPIPGIEGAWWSAQDDLHWAFLPGWSTVRMFTWSDASCSPEGITKILAQLVAAPEIPAGTPRTAMVPGVVPAPVDAKAPAPAPAPAAKPGVAG